MYLIATPGEISGKGFVGQIRNLRKEKDIVAQPVLVVLCDSVIRLLGDKFRFAAFRQVEHPVLFHRFCRGAGTQLISVFILCRQLRHSRQGKVGV